MCCYRKEKVAINHLETTKVKLIRSVESDTQSFEQSLHEKLASMLIWQQNGADVSPLEKWTLISALSFSAIFA